MPGGATYGRKTARLGHLTSANEILVKEINRIIAASASEMGFCWGSLQINVDTVSGPHEDKNNIGPSVIILMVEQLCLRLTTVPHPAQYLEIHRRIRDTVV